ncbi:murein L,D-transpeptidase [Methylosinus sp. H3A]|uniref:L,D-transpeptidase family protein n=1 Tax=Methylosinus sp. H3A TaxID=2785786 RepID=UPI0018C1E79A|nr:murein L,D-transpeptidase family protein [Methylosinus sp. H3A]MBG0810612.1 murein L,D-transpeptidase [Methylosinus sp. H3A]
MSLFQNAGRLARWGLVGAAFSLSACNDLGSGSQRSLTPIPPETLAMMEQAGVTKESPTLIRAYKKEAEFEVWKQRPDGRYAYLKTFPMCRWSGQLGPKVREGDRQVPEGFYSITPGQMNPNSAYYLSFNVGYPNAYDRAFGHGGGSIMVHGACSSAGCFSMTDRQIGEIYAILRTSFNNGQRSIQMQSYPFKMTAENLAKHRMDPNIGFWKQLKEGSDHFEIAGKEPAVGVCGRRYVFDAASANGQPLDASLACPPLRRNAEIEAQVAQKAAADEAKVAQLAAAGVRPVRVVYQDGGQHPDFYARVAEVSRPDALIAPIEIALDEKIGGSKSRSPLIAMSAAKLAAKAKKEAEIKIAAQPATTIKPAEAAPAEPTKLSAFAGATDSIGGLLGFPKEAPPAAPAAQSEAPAPVAKAEPAKAELSKAVFSKTEVAKAGKAGPVKASATKTVATGQSAASQAPASLPPHRVDPAKKPQASLGGEHRAKVAEAAASAPALREGLSPSARP